MPNRMLRDWTDSEKVRDISAEAERLFVRLIMKADDYGCFTADTRLIKAGLFPWLIDSIREADISRWMDECQKAGLIVFYEVKGKKYLCIQEFKQRLRIKKSMYPLPDNYSEDQQGDPAGMIYLIGSGDHMVKIGFSLNPWARVKELGTGSHKKLKVLATFKGEKVFEKEIHKILSSLKTEKEWFCLPKEVLDDIISWSEEKFSANEFYDKLRSNYANIRSTRSLSEENRSRIEVEEKGSPPPTKTSSINDSSVVVYPIEECLTIAMRDPRWIKANKATELELKEFNLLLERRGHYEKNPADYKSHYANWKIGGKRDDSVPVQAQSGMSVALQEKANQILNA